MKKSKFQITLFTIQWPNDQMTNWRNGFYDDDQCSTFIRRFESSSTILLLNVIFFFYPPSFFFLCNAHIALMMQLSKVEKMNCCYCESVDAATSAVEIAKKSNLEKEKK